jgi:hypothetical protein
MIVDFRPAPLQAEVYDFVEATLLTSRPIADPFRTVQVTATLNNISIAGFCDSPDGTVFRVRFMPTTLGEHRYRIIFRHAGEEQHFEGQFTATKSNRKGILQADGWGFRWSGTQEAFFWNGTTAYMMAGLSETKITEAIERLAALGVNRIRVSLSPTRQKDGGRWYEPQVAPRADFSYCYSPWVCANPEVWDDPQPDTTRFDVAYWQKFERLLTQARSHNMIVQVVFFTDAQEAQNYPFMRPAPKAEGASDFDHATRADDPNEHLYYAYTATRLAAFSNVEWCITNEWALFQSNAWVDEMGTFLRAQDPYGHLCSVHGHGHFPFRMSPWCTHALFQSWDEHGSYDFMLGNLIDQEATGRIIPQVNDEYGYEDHYPGPWGGARVAPARNADSRRRLAWEITMAGCHQTTGESAVSSTGGWINGLGDSGELLTYHQHLRAFFEAIPGWERLTPETGSVNGPGVLCLSEDNRFVVAYISGSGEIEVTLPGEWQGRWFNPRTGKWVIHPRLDQTPQGSPNDDWVLLLAQGDL